MENDHNNSKKGKCILVEPYSASNVIVLKTFWSYPDDICTCW